ncbi:amidohydrolase family protein [Sphingomonas sp. AOB5]|uniref:amidohydrolase family protein n=1 Tax=Sphingomonas sp. AOB5 TaxID=3034017 RepID=UPI0023F79C9D|nr:amidohydrolase family protein [Sphingomonas sp. AOB5]MDF7775918.1 amidohydrolase family protein [Sphingomonas sp. AOB5]
MKHRILAAALATASIVAGLPALAQVPKEQLMVPPADADKLVVISAAGQHGTAFRWRKDGTEYFRESILLRGMVWEQDQAIHIAANGQPDRIVIRGSTPQGDGAETFEIANGNAVWKSQIDSGSVRYDGKSQYSTAGGTWTSSATFAELLWKSPDKRMTLLPGGQARMTKLVDIPVGSGATAKTVTAWAIEGVGLEPFPVLMNADGSFFGIVFVMAILPEAYQGDFLKLQKAQNDALAARGPAVAKRFGQVSPVPVAFTNVRLFDADNGRFVEDQTVIADKGKIVAVGPASSVKVPANARVIDGRGKTLTPGLWDAHMHIGSDAQGVMLLSMGETSARDPGADVAPTIERRERIKRGELLFPTVYSSVLIDGKGPLQAQGGVTVSSAEEAVAAVRMAHEKGFTGVKFYTSMQPEWLKAGVAEAHKLGLHVHGHIPATMRPTDVIALGYDEITHINFVMMQAMPDEVVNVSNGLARFQGPGRYGKNVDLSAEPMRSLIPLMAKKGIVVDPTLAVFEQTYVAENGKLSSSYAPFLGTMPPSTERGFLVGGDAPPEGVTRADYQASFARMVQLVKLLNDAGVPIVAGTDGGGLELIRELELYVQAGMTPAEALRTATIVPARLVGADKTTGSIVVGKEADLVLVDGDPSKEIGAMRRTDWVMSDGALMNADELREQAGFSGRPK